MHRNTGRFPVGGSGCALLNRLQRNESVSRALPGLSGSTYRPGECRSSMCTDAEAVRDRGGRRHLRTNAGPTGGCYSCPLLP